MATNSKAAKDLQLSANSKKILNLLKKTSKPMSAYDMLHKLRSTTIKAPPTVYRALENLLTLGLIHRIHSLNAYMLCHEHKEGHAGCKESDHVSHGAQFAVCRSCGTVEEIHDHRIENYIKNIGKMLKFRIENETLELSGTCAKCTD